jgi:hypothetical protein
MMGIVMDDEGLPGKAFLTACLNNNNKDKGEVSRMINDQRNGYQECSAGSIWDLAMDEVLLRGNIFARKLVKLSVMLMS